MQHTRQEVVAELESKFPADRASEIMEVLDLYGREPHERERERVQLAILQLSDGNPDRLRHFVAVAKQDYRDVLSWAEEPVVSATQTDVLNVLRSAWALPDPMRVVSVNPFGNVVVACKDGSLWRVCPEELSAERIALEPNFETLLKDEEFLEDWMLEELAAGAKATLGIPNSEQCYGFNIWPAMGGTYASDNCAIKTLTEWLAVSGDVGRQVKDLPSGTKITLDTGRGS